MLTNTLHTSLPPIDLNWWTLPDSNRPPSACRADALPDELKARKCGRLRLVGHLPAGRIIDSRPPATIGDFCGLRRKDSRSVSDHYSTKIGASYGNRTRLACLEGRCTTSMPSPRCNALNWAVVTITFVHDAMAAFIRSPTASTHESV